MIDTHTHLYFPDYGNEISDIVKKSLEQGVSHFILPNVDMESVARMKTFKSCFPNVSSMAIGLHPTEVKDDWQEVLNFIKEEASGREYIAIGETGIDLYWDDTNLENQKEAFLQQLLLAEKYQLPVIIHSRNAFPETLEVIKEVKPSVPLVFHSFTGTKDNVKEIREICDPYFGINGVVTYKNAPGLREALSEIGINKIILETDAPFLTPVPHRGKRNDSSYLSYIRDKVAETLSLSPSEVERITDKTARDLFKLT